MSANSECSAIGFNQQIVLTNFDNRLRRREIVLQFIGE